MTTSSTSSADDNVDSPLPSSSSQRSSSNHYSHHHHFSPYILPTPTTRTQRKTEDEVSPFFVPVCAFAPSQLDHLRCVGLLPPLGPTTNDDNNDSNDNDDPLSLLYAIRLLRRAHGNYLRKALSIPLSRGLLVWMLVIHGWYIGVCIRWTYWATFMTSIMTTMTAIMTAMTAMTEVGQRKRKVWHRI
jgi:hypothetical protein